MNKKEELKNKYDTLKKEIENIDNKINELIVTREELTRLLRQANADLNEVLEKEFVEQRLKELNEKYPNGYNVYRYGLESGYCGCDKIGYFACSENYNYDYDLSEMANQNLQSYHGYITEEELECLMEEEGYDDEETALEELGLEIAYPEWWAEEVKEEDITSEMLEELQEF